MIIVLSLQPENNHLLKVTMKNYETVFILTPVLSETQMKDTVAKFKKVLKDHKAKIVNEENWGLKKTDRNIDHRRVPNLRRYFERQGFTVKTKAEKPEYKPGDLVTCRVGNRPHIMIVSDRKMPDGTPLIIHNIGSGTKEEDRLLQFEITGHYRLPAASQSTKQN